MSMRDLKKIKLSNKPGPKPGSTRKLSASNVWDVCNARGVNIVEKLLDICERVDDETAARIYLQMMRYIYHTKAPVTPEGEAAQVNLIVHDPQQIEDQIDRIKEARQLNSGGT